MINTFSVTCTWPEWSTSVALFQNQTCLITAWKQCTASNSLVAGDNAMMYVTCNRPAFLRLTLSSLYTLHPPCSPGCATKPSQSNVEYGVYCNGIPYAIGASCEAGCVTGSVSTTAGSYPRATCTLVGGVPTWTYTGGCVGREYTVWGLYASSTASLYGARHKPVVSTPARQSAMTLSE